MKARKISSKYQFIDMNEKGMSKRIAEDDQRFEESFEKLLCKTMSVEEYGKDELFD